MKQTLVAMTVGLLTAGYLGTGTAHAQATDDHGHLAELLPNLLRTTVTLSPPDVAGVPSHQAHFQPTATDNIYQLPNQFNGALLSSLATFPLGSSSGGFAFEGDPALGDFRPASRSYGPMFAERALTSGRRNFTFGFTHERANYTRFEDKKLADGDIKFYLQHTDCCNPIGQYPNPAFEGDLVEAAVSLNIETNTTAFLVNYGLTDRWDVGAAIPIVHVSMDASVRATVDRVATSAIPAIHHFPGADPDHSIASDSGSANGLGDVVLRTKYRFIKAQGGGLAAALDLRLPTGDDENLLGLGTTQAKLLLIGSKEMGAINPHVNISYAFAGDSGLKDLGVTIPKEFGYTFGVDAALGKVTAAFDVIGRNLIDAGRFADTTRSFPELGAPNATRQEFARTDGNLNQVLGAFSVKVPVMERLLVTASALFTMNSAGLRDKFIPVIGFDYVFPRH
jgi:hypothetical protein